MNDIDLYCWNDDMLQPADSVAIPQKPSNDKKVWYAIVRQDGMGISPSSERCHAPKKPSTVEAILDTMSDINYEVMRLDDAAEMLEV